MNSLNAPAGCRTSRHLACPGSDSVVNYKRNYNVYRTMRCSTTRGTGSFKLAECFARAPGGYSLLLRNPRSTGSGPEYGLHESSGNCRASEAGLPMETLAPLCHATMSRMNTCRGCCDANVSRPLLSASQLAAAHMPNGYTYRTTLGLSVEHKPGVKQQARNDYNMSAGLVTHSGAYLPKPLYKSYLQAVGRPPQHRVDGARSRRKYVLPDEAPSTGLVTVRLFGPEQPRSIKHSTTPDPTTLLTGVTRATAEPPQCLNQPLQCSLSSREGLRRPHRRLAAAPTDHTQRPACAASGASRSPGTASTCRQRSAGGDRTCAPKSWCCSARGAQECPQAAPAPSGSTE